MSKQKMMIWVISFAFSCAFAQLALVGDVSPPNAQTSSIIRPIKGM